LQLRVPYDWRKIIRLKDGEFKNDLKKNKTTKFEIVEVRIMVVDKDRKYDCIITLRRIYLYHVINTYLPTVTLLIISEITLFFDEKNMQVGIITDRCFMIRSTSNCVLIYSSSLLPHLA